MILWQTFLNVKSNGQILNILPRLFIVHEMTSQLLDEPPHRWNPPALPLCLHSLEQAFTESLLRQTPGADQM
jgi:hypothetical protein